ncbi:MAG: threonine synthase [Chloroflexi bacterium]|nr:MAG: threonine synthase [Chloroflexota bacterium]|tara:strand:- start:18439 stop:19521 length:1083 start_codon:yes stop_codon:yes gene_type:complete
MKKILFDHYKDFLPVNSSTPMVSLGEGFTPLVKSLNFSEKYDCDLYFKLEGCNPSGSFKDRGMFLAVAKALEKKKSKIICASTGNTSASAAAYGARYNLQTIVIIPSGKIAVGKLLQAMAYGAQIVSIKGNFDQALEAVKQISDSMDFEIVNSINPFRLEGQKTGSFEIVDELNQSPDYQFMPVGNAGNISSYFMGYKLYLERKKIKNIPTFFGIQAENSAPLVDGKIIENPSTVATAIRIGNPASSDLAKEAVNASQGEFLKVSDEEIISAQSLIAKHEGIFCEPASAASFAGLLKKINNGLDVKNKKIVCILTGNGLKDPENAQKYLKSKIIKTSSSSESIKKAILSGSSTNIFKRMF